MSSKNLTIWQGRTKITGEPAVSLCPTFQASLDSFKGYFVIIITVFKTDVKEEKKTKAYKFKLRSLQPITRPSV